MVETIEILQARQVDFVRPCDFWPDAASFRTQREYDDAHARWQHPAITSRGLRFWRLWNKLRRRKVSLTNRVSKALYPSGRPQVFIQHDADRVPERTLQAMKLECDRGAVSASYFFRERSKRWAGDDEAYVLPVDEMSHFESKGFEIGYHLNAPERANYCDEKTWSFVAQDIDYFASRFRLRSFVPHGGRAGPGGVNNHHIEQKPPLDSLVWFYNGRGFSCDVAWSDGGIASAESRFLPDPRVLARQITGRMRARFLFHPQYYGDSPCKEAWATGVSKTKWWKSVWAEN